MGRGPHRKTGGVTSPPLGDLEDVVAEMEGHLAMLTLQDNDAGLPVRLSALNKLRVAARRDPSAAYNLGNFFSRSETTGKRGHYRRVRANALFERSALSGLARLTNANAAFKDAPKREEETRDIISRSLCNIGADLANRGYPDRALDYFQRALKIYPMNANAEVCLGNMGVYHAKATGMDPLAGLSAWERAAKLGDWCHESEKGCPCRANVIRIARQVQRDHGAEAARHWVGDRYARMPMKSGKLFLPLVSTPAVVKLLSGKPWSLSATDAASSIGPLLAQFRGEPLPDKVTLAASILGLIAVAWKESIEEARGSVGQALTLVSGFDPLSPFLGDDEWQDLGPPETLYVTAPAYLDRMGKRVKGIVLELFRAAPEASAMDAMLGLLFHLDSGFRRGVTSMFLGAYPGAERDQWLIPAAVIGSPARH